MQVELQRAEAEAHNRTDSHLLRISAAWWRPRTSNRAALLCPQPPPLLNGSNESVTPRELKWTYNELLEHALRKDLRLGITLRWELANGRTLPPSQDPDIPLGALKAVAESLRLLVVLRVVLPSRYLERFCLSLQQPAPRLRFLELAASDDESFDGILPSDSLRLFADFAPLLRHLRAPRTVLGSKPIAAFANVERFKTVYPDSFTLGLPLRTHLPKLMSLTLSFWDRHDGDGVTLAADLHGLSLNILVRKNTRWRSPSTQALLDRIPVVKHVYRSIYDFQWSQPHGWRHDFDELCITISGLPNNGFTLCATPANDHDAWQRIYRLEGTTSVQERHSFIPSGPYDRFFICDLPGALGGLSALRLHSAALLAFFDRAAEFLALRIVDVDVPRPSTRPAFPIPLCGRWAEHSTDRVRCPTLERLAVYVPPPGAENYLLTPRIDLQDVASFCRALGPGAKPALELHGAILDDVLARSEYVHLPPYTVQGTFSGVRTLPPAALARCAEPEGCIWDEELRRL
ncbi:hypothetical protein AURDEDRAFT_129080 [Auricularia subglabra TFB-10046 SS5]|nr:hypothetical protein AURDEDRAFT_129080 [Auricularia subglabra TFB-10046 SS5]